MGIGLRCRQEISAEPKPFPLILKTLTSLKSKMWYILQGNNQIISREFSWKTCILISNVFY